MTREYLKRILDNTLSIYLETFGAVLIEGPKWCGKTTTAELRSKSVLKLQDVRKSQDYLKLADIDPNILLKGENPRLIDEWQMAPVLWDAVRAEVDERNEEGLFILTGSTIPNDDATMHTGTGRIARLLMRPLSLFESLESNGKISLFDLFSNTCEIDGIRSQLTIEGIAFAICRGGWPSSIGKSERSALLIIADYLNSLCESDVSRVDGVEKNPKKVKSIIRSYSRNISSLVSNTTILKDVRANDTQISEPTMYSYFNALTRLYVIEDVLAWNPSIRSKTVIRSSNKKMFIDPSLAAASLVLTPNSLLDDLNTFGFLFEALCIRDLRIYSQELGGGIYYYHDRYGLECDAVIRLNDGRYALVEIKLGSKEIDEGAAHLIKIEQLLTEHKMKKPSFLMILTGNKIAYTRKDGVMVVPIGCLKN